MRKIAKELKEGKRKLSVFASILTFPLTLKVQGCVWIATSIFI